jgi:hypothetical protein
MRVAAPRRAPRLAGLRAGGCALARQVVHPMRCETGARGKMGRSRLIVGFGDREICVRCGHDAIMSVGAGLHVVNENKFI